jgi:hypothetical protein
MPHEQKKSGQHGERQQDVDSEISEGIVISALLSIRCQTLICLFFREGRFYVQKHTAVAYPLKVVHAARKI